jgi:3-methyl-2-oxobutanoate hydroxymethyltransferase
MQAERVAGFKEFISDVRSGAFPAPQHVIKAADGLVDGFLEAIEKNG